MYCKNCGEALNANQAICVKCGVNVGVGNAYCSNCGSALAPGAAVCLNCGVAANNSARKVGGAQLGGQDKLVMILIALFLGGFGVHNFMMGESKKGIVKIICCFVFGISGILALIDLIRIATDSYTVDPNAYF